MSNNQNSNLIRPEDEFQQHVLANLDQAEQQLSGYRFVGLRSLIAEYGAVDTAKRLLDPSNLSHPYDGFSVLTKNQLLDRSLEKAVVTFANRGLFHVSIISAATVRLAIGAKKSKSF